MRLFGIRVQPALAIGFAVFLSLGARADEPVLLGFSPPASAAQQALERNVDGNISAQQIGEWNAHLSARPHHAGSAFGRESAQFLLKLFESWGFDAEIETFHILLPTPRTRELELLGSTPFVASLNEQILPEDPSTGDRDEVLPPYNAFSIDGEVTGELVFVNYGIPEDYELLERHGVDVKGKIAIARYGRSWRGIKPKLAAEKGAIGTLIYSDPADDGYAVGDAYPDGAFKHASAVQRGSVMDMPTYPGDVLTPGKGATKRARRLKRDAAPTITRIPVLPISHRDAEPLLRALGGEVVPAAWRGALPFTYHLGPGPARVRLKVEFDWNTIEIYNVIARLEGSQYPDEWVIRGNHHDAWNHGSADPVSGLAALLAEARAVGTAARAGNRPKRTIVYAAWDAEEPGLIGSTEWVETHRQDLDRHAVAYINTDGNARGFLGLGGSHTLEQFFNQVAEAVVDPQTGVSLKKRREAVVQINGSEEVRADLKKRGALRLSPLGSGSDYTPFLQHLGIASANVGFGGEGNGGSYHTLYDTYAHYAKFRDPGFRYGAALAQTTARATLRLANANLLPFRYGPLANNIEKYVHEIEKLAVSKRKAAQLVNQQLKDKQFELALDPQRTLRAPKGEARVPYFNFAPLKNALVELVEVATALDMGLDKAPLTGDLARLNALLFGSERKLTHADGLPGRNWYRHQIYAPGFYTGYGVKTLPRVREAIEAERYGEVNEQIAHTAATLVAFTDYLRGLSGQVDAAVLVGR